ncbi:MAG: kdpA [Rhodospirillales bacterium]|nr:kdpA [Rhodospirillales bacterium]
MTPNGWLQIALFGGLVVLVTKPLGAWMHAVFEGRRRWLGPVETAIYRAAGIDETKEQHWTGYAIGMLLFSAVSIIFLYLLQRFQGALPLNPMGLDNNSADNSFNTAVSFVTNTNWQSYTPETTMSYLTQMVGLTVQNFASAAVGIALAIALARGFTRRQSKTIGNFWVDLVRGTLYVLLPISIVVALLLVWQGVPQNFSAYVDATTLEGATQQIAQGPVASQEAIKMLGTNGGGFFNTNSAHPYENPTPLSNLAQMVLIFCLGAGLTNTFGRMIGDQRQGWAILAAMGMLWLGGVTLAYWAEAAGNPAFTQLGVDQSVTALQSGGNMEGKEVRFGIAASALFATVTTDASCGAVNSFHDSFMPLGGMVPLINMMLGEVIVGGVGAGLYGMLLFVIIAIFIAGLMVGRTPEYVGKKIEAKEVKMTILAILCLPLVMLGFTAISSVIEPGLAGLANAGPHGFTEMLYAYTSGAANNGSAFAGLSANTPWYNYSLGVAMFIGRFFVILPMLAIAGSLAAKKIVPASSGTFPTHGTLFVVLLVGTIAIVGGLTFFPALALGPIVEHLAMQAGASF